MVTSETFAALYSDGYGRSRKWVAIHFPRLSEERIDDITQTAWCRAWEKKEQWRGTCKFLTWVYKIAFNEALSYLRSAEGRIEEHSVDFADLSFFVTTKEEGAVPIVPELFVVDGPYEQINMRLDAIALLGSIRPDLQRLLILKYACGRSVEEVAQISGLTVANTKTRLWRARHGVMERANA